MAQLNPYPTFNGNCMEAMNFYKKCLGGELIFQTIGESPMADKMPAKMKDYILHAMLSNSEFVMMATDCVTEQGLIKGNSVSLALICSSEKEIKNIYKKLSEGGNASHPLENTFRGAYFGNFTDNFGNRWVLNYDKNQKQ
jgi:PhnB protein